MTRWANLVLGHRLAWAVVVVALTAALGHQAATRLRVDTSLDEYLATDDEVRIRLERFHEEFGRAEVFLVVAEGPVFTPDYLHRLRALQEAVEADEAPLEEVSSLWNARHVQAGGGAVRVGGLGDDLDDPPTPEQVAALRARVDASSALAGHLVDPDGSASALLVRTALGDDEASHALYDRLSKLAEAHAAPGFELHVSGAPALGAAIHARMIGDAHRSLGLALLGMALLLGLLFRHWLAIAGPLLVVALSLVWTFGAMAALGYPMTGMHNVLPTLLLTVGLGDSVHLLSVHRRLLEGRDPLEATREAIAQTGLPIVLTSLTTAAGMLGFTVTRLGVTTRFGAFAALGVCLAMLHSLVVLPLLLSLRSAAGLRREDPRAPLVQRATDALVGAAVRHPGRVLAGAVLLVVVSLGGLLQLRVSHNPIRFLPVDNPVRAAFASADRHLGGTVNLELEVDTGRAGGLMDPAMVQGFARLEAVARSLPDVGGVSSWLDVVRETWKALGGARLPDTRAAVAQSLLAFEMGDRQALGRVMTGDARYGRMTLRVPCLEAHEYRPLADRLDAAAREAFGDRARVGPTGGVYTLLTIVDSLVTDMVRSFGLAVLLVFLLLVALLRSARLGVLAMVPNLLPVALTLALMGYAGIPLDMFNLLLASIAIGVVVDDTVHFFHHVAVRRRAGEAVEAAIRGAAAASGRALVTTSAVLCVGFGAFTTALMQNLVQLGVLLVFTVVCALLAELLVGPALLRRFERSL